MMHDATNGPDSVSSPIVGAVQVRDPGGSAVTSFGGMCQRLQTLAPRINH